MTNANGGSYRKSNIRSVNMTALREGIKMNDLQTTHPPLIDFAGYMCTGCDITAEELVYQEGWTKEDIDNNQVETNCGNWYCHSHCLRDSR